MQHELEARTMHGMEERIENLKTMLKDIESDFTNCAQGKSPCIYCANDKCNNNCNFVWKPHN